VEKVGLDLGDLEDGTGAMGYLELEEGLFFLKFVLEGEDLASKGFSFIFTNGNYIEVSDKILIADEKLSLS